MASHDTRRTPGGLRRLGTIVLALGMFVATGGYLWRAFGSAPAAGSSSTPDLAKIFCAEGKTDVLTPVVRVQADGVHFLIDGVGEPSGITVTIDGRGSVGSGFPAGETYPVGLVLEPPVGEARIRCGPLEDDDVPASMTGAPIGFVDPGGIWHDEMLSCVGVGGALGERSGTSYFTEGNPVEQVLPRVVPGVRVTDQISYGNYPRGEAGSVRYRIVRDGQVEATFELLSYDDRQFVYSLVSCDSSHIGDPDVSTSGTPATPFQLPGYDRCDPYEATCVPVVLSVARYAEGRGEDVGRYAYPEIPWAACQKDQPEGCPSDPNELVLTILLSPGDADDFVAQESCGEPADPCM